MVWAQGCTRACPGCCNSQFADASGGTLVSADDLVSRILDVNDIEGVTFSGGEPFEQASGLASVARLVRDARDLGVVCFTGYALEELLTDAVPSAGELLQEIDLLIDGPFVAGRPGGSFWRGSDNQRLHHLSSRYVGLTEPTSRAAGRENELEVGIRGDQSIATGDFAHSALEEVAELLARLHGVRL